jgi:hypothetical protein
MFQSFMGVATSFKFVRYRGLSEHEAVVHPGAQETR